MNTQDIKPFLEGSGTREQMLWRRQKSRQWNYQLALMSVQTRDIQKVTGEPWLWLWLSFTTQENLLTYFLLYTGQIIVFEWVDERMWNFLCPPVFAVDCLAACWWCVLALMHAPADVSHPLTFPLCILAVFHHLSSRWAFQCVWLQTVFKHQCDGAFDYDSFIRSQSLLLTSRRWIIHRWKKSKGLKW